LSDINVAADPAGNQSAPQASASVDSAVSPPAPPPIAVAAAEASAPPTRHRFVFTGDGAEYFKIWIVNVLLTIVTIGIYSAWAKVRRLRYFYNNTKFAGSTFDFHGSPIAILKGRIVAVVLILLLQVPVIEVVVAVFFVYLLGLPWLLYRSFRFHMANTSYRNLRFNFTGNSKGAYIALGLPLAVVFGVMAFGGAIVYFGGTAGKVFGIAVLICSVIVFYLMGPYLQYRVTRYYVTGAELGTSPFNFHVKGLEFYVPYAIAFAVMMALGVVMSVVMAVTIGASLGDLKNLESGAETMGKGTMIAMFVVMGAFYIAMLAVGPLIIALVHNMVWRGTSLHEKRFHSDLSVLRFIKVWMIVTFLTIITLGLYRPFAAVKLAKLRVEATSWTGSADDLIAVLRDGNQRALGSEVADLMDVDFGI
jgi:uncharacterized membrane protein YjgN (DUF898 family)